MARSTVLDGLPLEMIQRILMHGDCKSALALSAGNKSLHAACNNTFVFQRLITHGNATLSTRSHDDPGEEERRNLAISPWTVPGLNDKALATHWARWALADSRAMQILPGLLRGQEEVQKMWNVCEKYQVPRALLDNHIDLAFRALSRSQLRWLPHLLISRHPILHVMAPEAFVNTIKSLTNALVPVHRGMTLRNTMVLAKASFCLAAVTVHADIPARCFGHPYQNPMDIILDVLTRPLFESKWDYDLGIKQLPPSTRREYHKSLHARTLVYTAITAMAYEIHEMQPLLRSGPQTPPSQSSSALHPIDRGFHPRPPSVIPHADLMDVPPPFLPWKDESQVHFPTWHLNAMTGPEFLAGGPWIGYISYASGGMASLEVQRLSFEVREGDDGAAHSTVQLSGEGRNPSGAFTLAGTLDRKTGWAHWRRNHTCGWPCGRHWDYVGWMTPFGIAGVWGFDRWGPGMLGWFWLWKQEWSEPWPEQ